ncbi:protein PEAK3 [Ctenodactylus gundi]
MLILPRCVQTGQQNVDKGHTAETPGSSAESMSGPEPTSDAPEPEQPTSPAQPVYDNLGEVRAHLLPCKACRRPRTPVSLSSPEPRPPPLPKKTLCRAQSLPTCGLPVSSATHAAAAWPQGQYRAEDNQAPPTAALGPLLRGESGAQALHEALAARELQGLRAVHQRMQTRLTGGRPGPCRVGHGFRLLDRAPCLESGDAFYYRVVRVDDGEAWHILAAKVPKLEAPRPDPWGLELQASLSPHFNLQGLCGLVPEGALPGAPWQSPVALTTEVPERTVAQWLAEVGALPPTELAWAVALMVLQLSAALELLETKGAALSELRPENLLLAAPRGCPAGGPLRLLFADFGHVRQRPPGPPGAHAGPLGRLLRTLMGPVPPGASPLAGGLERLATQLPRARPSATQTRGALQALLWGPGRELHGREAALGSWLRVRRALLLVHLAERAAGGEAPGLEEWLCCEYLTRATEASLGHALELLWADPK